MRREFPHRPIAAVGGVVIRRNEILLVRRGKEPGRGQWSIPGGAVHLGESLKEAVQREVLEEAGIRVHPIRPIEVIERILPQGERTRYHYIIVDYACVFDGGELQSGSDAAEARWIPWSELDALGLSQETRSVIEKGREVLKGLE